MLVTATFDYLIDDYTDTLAQHTFFTKQDLCNKDADDTPIAEPEGNILVINNATTRGGVKPEDPDTVGVVRADPNTGAPASIEITVNGNHPRSSVSSPPPTSRAFGTAGPTTRGMCTSRSSRPMTSPSRRRSSSRPGLVTTTCRSTARSSAPCASTRATTRSASPPARLSPAARASITSPAAITDFLNGGPEDDTLLGGGAFDSSSARTETIVCSTRPLTATASAATTATTRSSTAPAPTSSTATRRSAAPTPRRIRRRTAAASRATT